MSLNNYINVLGMKIDMVQIPDVLKAMDNWIVNKSYSNYIVVSNAYDMVTNYKDDKIKKAANNSSLTVPDGISLVLLARLCGYPLRKRVYGPDLTLEFLKIAQDKGYSNFFYGATQETLDLLNKKLKEKFPRLSITGSYSPPFRELSHKEKEKIVNIINDASPDVLWVGLGTPKQQLWMSEHKDKIKVPVMVGVGAAFDFLSGAKKQAPKWMRENGFEWLFRLITEPKRLWKRYILGNPIFIYLVCKEFISGRLLRRKIKTGRKAD